MSKQLRIKTDFANEISVEAIVVKSNILHRLGIVKNYKDMVEYEDYIVVKTKPKSVVIILNADEKYKYNIISKPVDKRLFI